MTQLLEDQFKLRDLDQDRQDKLYQAFYNSYVRATGAAWDKDTFTSKAYSWVFFGDLEGTGGIAVRPQNSGLVKMNAVYGSPRAIMAGMQELVTTWGDRGLWTVATKDIVDSLNKRFGFKTPPVFVMRLLVPILSKILGGHVEKIEKDGGLSITDPHTGNKLSKYFTGNTSYYKHLLKPESLALLGDKIQGTTKKIIMKALSLLAN